MNLYTQRTTNVTNSIDVSNPQTESVYGTNSISDKFNQPTRSISNREKNLIPFCGFSSILFSLSDSHADLRFNSMFEDEMIKIGQKFFQIHCFESTQKHIYTVWAIKSLCFFPIKIFHFTVFTVWLCFLNNTLKSTG